MAQALAAEEARVGAAAADVHAPIREVLQVEVGGCAVERHDEAPREAGAGAGRRLGAEEEAVLAAAGAAERALARDVALGAAVVAARGWAVPGEVAALAAGVAAALLVLLDHAVARCSSQCRRQRRARLAGLPSPLATGG